MSVKLRLVLPPDPAEELEALQEHVLAQLDLLNRRIEAVIKEFAPPEQVAASAALSQSAAAPQGDKAAA
jgi:hypothetical protein